MKISSPIVFDSTYHVAGMVKYVIMMLWYVWCTNKRSPCLFSLLYVGLCVAIMSRGQYINVGFEEGYRIVGYFRVQMFVV